LQRPAAAPFAKPIALPPDGEHVAVVEQTIQDRGCHDRIAKYRAPLTDGPVRGHQHSAALISAADELE
jgi:hypothetical protein